MCADPKWRYFWRLCTCDQDPLHAQLNSEPNVVPAGDLYGLLLIADLCCLSVASVKRFRPTGFPEWDEAWRGGGIS